MLAKNERVSLPPRLNYPGRNVRPLIIRCSSVTLPLVAALDRACFPDPIPGDKLLAYRKLPAAGLEDGLFSLVDSGPMKVPLALMLLLTVDSDGGHRLAAYTLPMARESYFLIDRLSVHPDHRGKGYSAALLAAAALSGNVSAFVIGAWNYGNKTWRAISKSSSSPSPTTPRPRPRSQ